jgi:hypothetical protein
MVVTTQRTVWYYTLPYGSTGRRVPTATDFYLICV